MNKAYLSLGVFLILLGVAFTVAGTVLGVPLIVLGLLAQLKGRGKIDRIFSLTDSRLSFECNALKIGVFSFWVLFILSIISLFLEEGYLPPEVVAFDESQLESISDWVLVPGAGLLLLSFIGSIGVFLIKKWGRISFVIGYLGMLLLSPFTGVTLSTPIFGTLNMAMDILAGIIICMLYFTPAKEYFE